MKLGANKEAAMYICNDKENAKEKSLSDIEVEAILDGLDLILEQKKTALASIGQGGEVPHSRQWRPEDFGIPMIEKLIAYLEEE